MKLGRFQAPGRARTPVCLLILDLMMMVLSANGDLIHVEKLKKSIHPQPEGLCFDAVGNMYIANEGKDDSARIYKYNYQP